MASQRSSTPPGQNNAAGADAPPPRTPLTPDQLRRIEINRMKAKALREQRDAEARNTTTTSSANTQNPGAASSSSSPPVVAGQKRPYSSTLSTSRSPSTVRDGRTNNAASDQRPLDAIRPARNFTKYVEYDFSKMTDTKGGFITTEDDPYNRALQGPEDGAKKPAHMTQREWERQQLLQSLEKQKSGPFEPGLSILDKNKTCRECESLEIDWKWEEIFGCAVCNTCKEKLPEKYSLLTKTEAKEDYLLTDPELKDEELLAHMERPNPHKSTWNNMMLFLRCQVEEYAFSPKKWGSPEGLDAEFEKRENDKKRRKEAQFKSKLHELKKRTRVEAYRRSRQANGGKGGKGGGGGGGEANFGDDVGGRGKHVHQWGRAVGDPETGIGVKTCVDCGMEVEELEF